MYYQLQASGRILNLIRKQQEHTDVSNIRKLQNLSLQVHYVPNVQLFTQVHHLNRYALTLILLKCKIQNSVLRCLRNLQQEQMISGPKLRGCVFFHQKSKLFVKFLEKVLKLNGFFKSYSKYLVRQILVVIILLLIIKI